jgi:hypothetical protein
VKTREYHGVKLPVPEKELKGESALKDSGDETRHRAIDCEDHRAPPFEAPWNKECDEAGKIEASRDYSDHGKLIESGLAHTLKLELVSESEFWLSVLMIVVIIMIIGALFRR